RRDVNAGLGRRSYEAEAGEVGRRVEDGRSVLADGIAEYEPVTGPDVGCRGLELVGNAHAGRGREREAFLEVRLVAAVVVDLEARRRGSGRHDALLRRNTEPERLGECELLRAEDVGHLDVDVLELRGHRLILRVVAGQVSRLVDAGREGAVDRRRVTELTLDLDGRAGRVELILQGDAHGHELGCVLRTPGLVAAHVAGGTGVDQDGRRQQGCYKGSPDQREQATRPRRASGHGDLLQKGLGWKLVPVPRLSQGILLLQVKSSRFAPTSDPARRVYQSAALPYRPGAIAH